ncbi:RDD family protein [Flavobacterium sp.]|uniref:RDD family protein n=1 Tax=Flavobacterium sp. TaxID=239 RepID=UPI002FD9D880
MEGKNPKQFTVTQELLASHAQRFLNLLSDTMLQVVLFLIVLMVVEASAAPAVNKAFQSYVLVNPIGQYTFVSVIALLYYNIFEVLLARTPGKFITQTLVVDINGDLPNHQMILVRTLCRLIPFNGLSFLGFPARGWHDSISKTYVVNKKLLEEKKRLFTALEPKLKEE